MYKRVLAFAAALCLMIPSLSINVLAENDWIIADNVDAAVPVLGGEGELSEPELSLEPELSAYPEAEGDGEPDSDVSEIGVEALDLPPENADALSLETDDPGMAETLTAGDAADDDAPADPARDASDEPSAEDAEPGRTDGGDPSESMDTEIRAGEDADDGDGERPSEEAAADEPVTAAEPSDETAGEETPEEEPSADEPRGTEDADGDSNAEDETEPEAPAQAEDDAAATDPARMDQVQDVDTAYKHMPEAASAVKLEAGAVSLPYKTLRMGKGDSVRLKPSLSGGVSSVTYTSSKKRIVRVGADGVVRGLRPGTAYVTLRTSANKTFRLKVIVKRAPAWIQASPNPLKLGVGETYTLGYKTPAGTAGSVTFKGNAPSVFSVNAETGEIKALAKGSGSVTLTAYNGKTATCPVTVYNAPMQVTFDSAQTSVARKKKIQLQMKFDAGSWSNVTYEVVNPAVAKVSPEGVVTGVSIGKTVIRARTFVPNLTAETVFMVYGPPKRVWVDQKKLDANVGQPFKLEPRIPEGSRATFKFRSSRKKVATVSADGTVTPRKKGKAKITITTQNKKKVTVTVTVHDPGQLSTLKLKDKKVAPIYVGDTWAVEYVYAPITAKPNLIWTSNNPDVATVDQNGNVRGVSFGYATIKAVSATNKKKYIKFQIAVQTKDLTLVIPDRTTGIDGIQANMALIDAIRTSALGEIDRLQAAGSLSAASASKRKSMVNNIFANYAFPWMTPSRQKYWKAKYSEGGRKNFKAGRVYYGMPYISGSGTNRHYSPAQALREGRFTDSGAGYYLLNKGKYLNGRYVGNDCSGLVNVSIWEDGSTHMADRTGDIFVSGAYKTVNSFSAMLPGDLLCKANSHVVMFLYYASADKSKIMIIENGGSELGTNTVHCDVHTLSSYRKSGYRVRRLASL